MLLRETIGKLVSVCFFGLGFFWAIWDRDGQAWHDKLAGTVIVRSEGSLVYNQPSNAWPLAGLTALLIALFGPMFCSSSPRDAQWRTPQYAEARQPPESANSYQQSSMLAPQSDAASPSVQVNREADVTPENSTAAAIELTERFAPEQQATDLDQQQQHQVEAQISDVLQSWASAANANDPSAQAQFYADVVGRYFLMRGVHRADVEQNKELFRSKGDRFLAYDIQDVRFASVSSKVAYLTLTKSYEFQETASAPIQKTVHSRFWFQNTEKGWRIVGEQDLLH